jgi:hypothetical protein
MYVTAPDCSFPSNRQNSKQTMPVCTLAHGAIRLDARRMNGTSGGHVRADVGLLGSNAAGRKQEPTFRNTILLSSSGLKILFENY